MTQWRQLVSCDWSWYSHGSLTPGKYDLKINRSMKTPWQECSAVACSYSLARGMRRLEVERGKGEIFTCSARVVHARARQVISWRVRERRRNVQKTKIARAKRAELLFFIVKCATLWRSCRCFCLDFLNSLCVNGTQLLRLNLYVTFGPCKPGAPGKPDCPSGPYL